MMGREGQGGDHWWGLLQGRYGTRVQTMASRSRCSRVQLAAAVCATTLTLVGCSSAGSSAGTAPSKGPSTPSTSASTPPACPNPEGGACLGTLDAGTTYTTQVFEPQLSYRVPARGWSNYEDTPGNFLLVPPGDDLPGVNAGTSDFIGVYTAVVPARITDPNGCLIDQLSGSWTPTRMASWFTRQPDLITSRALPVSIGGLEGVMVDLRTKPGARLTSCTDGGQRIKLAGLFTGQSPSSLDHAVIPNMTMRLIMLASAGKVLLVELDDIDDAPVGLTTLTAVARRLEFQVP